MPKIHGKSKTYEYRVWAGIKKRCFNRNDHTYQRYGARGITMCNAWRHSFITFFEDMGPAPAGFQIDRINGAGNYTPENCRWASRRTQAQNKERTIFLTLNGTTNCIAEWARLLNVSPDMLESRYWAGWKDVEILTRPSNFGNNQSTFATDKFVTFEGQTMSISNWAKKLNINNDVLTRRLRTGWDVEKALTTPLLGQFSRSNDWKCKKLITFNKKTLTIDEWSEVTSVCKETLRGRLQQGWSLRKTLTTPLLSNSARKKRKKNATKLRS